MTRTLRRFEGRLFAEGGCLFLVVHADEATGRARVTCRLDRQTEVVEMPLAEVARRIAAAPTLRLDNLSGPPADARIVARNDGWYFVAREGLMGPFASRRVASRELVRHVLDRQVAGCRRDPRTSKDSRSMLQVVEKEALAS